MAAAADLVVQGVLTPPIKTALLAALMEAVAAEADQRPVLLEAQALLAQCVLFGLELLARSHQLAQAISNQEQT